MSYKSFFITTLSLLLFVLVAFSAATVIVDPFFHYHAPLSSLAYPINNQRYQNDGILRNFDYDSVITGTSMTENFSVSQWDTLFDAKTVKVSLSGSYLKETADRLDTAFASNDHIKYVVRSLDFYSLTADKDTVSDFEYPAHLYDNNVFNDVKYMLNKSVFFNRTCQVIVNTLNGGTTTDFDAAFNWSDNFLYGKQPVLERYYRCEKSDTVYNSFDDQKQTIKENVEQNVIRLATEHPETEFYLFYPPYSIITWDSWNQAGDLPKNVEIMRYVSELLLGYENIHLYSFNDDFDTICNLDNYKDLEHYGDWINEDILENMKNRKGLITKENIDLHFDSLKSFYSDYHYDAIFN